jgi:hypothetical protein
MAPARAAFGPAGCALLPEKRVLTCRSAANAAWPSSSVCSNYPTTPDPAGTTADLNQTPFRQNLLAAGPKRVPRELCLFVQGPYGRRRQLRVEPLDEAETFAAFQTLHAKHPHEPLTLHIDQDARLTKATLTLRAGQEAIPLTKSQGQFFDVPKQNRSYQRALKSTRQQAPAVATTGACCLVLFRALSGWRLPAPQPWQWRRAGPPRSYRRRWRRTAGRRRHPGFPWLAHAPGCWR